jgi:hypothetical protein
MATHSSMHLQPPQARLNVRHMLQLQEDVRMQKALVYCLCCSTQEDRAS